MNTSIPIPSIGTRFLFHGSQFEISFIGNGICRYSAITGGRIFQIPYIQFEEWYKTGLIEYEFSPKELLIDPQMTTSLVRKFKYVQAALMELQHPTATQPLIQIIQKIAKELEDQSPPDPRTVARWIHKYRLHNNDPRAIEKKKSGNHHLRFSIEIERLIHKGIQDIYLKEELRDGKDVEAYLHGKVLEDNLVKHKLPNLRTIQRRINCLDPYVILKAKKGTNAAKKALKAAGRSISSPHVLALVEIDTHDLDIIIIDESGAILGRPFLSCAIDVHTRTIVGTHISLYPPSALTTMCVIKDMVCRPKRGLPGGVPSQIIPDNGIEFKNNSFARLCETLKITITPSQVGTPNNKPHIESFFRSLTKGIIQKLPGTTFSNPSAKGDYDAVKHAKLTLQEVKNYIEEWINGVYYTEIHSEMNRAPIKAWEDAIKIVKPISLLPEEANILCRKPHQCTIKNGRVLFDYLHYFSHVLCTLEEQQLVKVTVLIDEMDLSRVYVVDPTNKHNVIIAESTELEYTQGLNYFAHQEAKKIKKEMAQADIQRLGKNANLLARWKLLEKIQNDLQKKKRKLRRLTIDIPQEIQNLSKSVKQNDILTSPPPKIIQESNHYSSFSSMDL
ncbi:DDE-type integrase/transposase/recombinase [Acinetobacter nosocomialis]|uniref:Mu transposase C-terminal domain-containing protein n=1 Tax=Acinetobacter nosocomialis TaxID=106654 RepID=UPI002F402724